MKRCPECGRTFTNSTLAYCLNDGTALVEDIPQPPPYYGAPSPPPEPPVYSEPPVYQAPPAQSEPPPAAGTPLPAFSVSTKTSYYGNAQTLYAGVPKRKFPWRRLLSVVIIAVALGRVWMHSRQPQWNTAPDSQLRLSLTTAIKNADGAEALSVRSLDAAPLSSSYSGTALAQEVSRVQDLKNKGNLVDERLLSQNYTAFRVSPDRTEAQVDVTETWTTATYSTSSRQKIGVNPPHDTPQTVYLRQSNGNWIIEKIEFHNS